MKNSSTYWNYATFAAIPIGICNIVPTYANFIFSTTAFSSFELIWKMVTSFLILMLVGKKMVKEIAPASEGYTYGQSFKWCYLSCLLASIVEGLLNIFYIKVMDPTYTDKLFNTVMQVVEQNPQYNAQMQDQMTSTLTTFLTPGGILTSTILSAILCGAIMSLIVAATIKKAPDLSIDENE